jgi:hypothetical protein
MPFDGVGNFTRSYNFTADKLALIKIQSVRVDGEFDNYATAMNQVMLRSGVAPLTGALKMGNNSIGGVAAGAANTPSYSFNGDVTTGIFQPSAGVIGVSSGGAEVGRFTAAGFVTTGLVSAGNLSASGTSTFGGVMTLTVAPVFTDKINTRKALDSPIFDLGSATFTGVATIAVPLGATFATAKMGEITIQYFPSVSNIPFMRFTDQFGTIDAGSKYQYNHQSFGSNGSITYENSGSSFLTYAPMSALAITAGGYEGLLTLKWHKGAGGAITYTFVHEYNGGGYQYMTHGSGRFASFSTNALQFIFGMASGLATGVYTSHAFVIP